MGKTANSTPAVPAVTVLQAKAFEFSFRRARLTITADSSGRQPSNKLADHDAASLSPPTLPMARGKRATTQLPAGCPQSYCTCPLFGLTIRLDTLTGSNSDNTS